MSESQIVQRPETVKDYLALPDYKLRFQEVLGQRAAQFMSALVSVASQPHLAKCEPRSVIGAAMVAATLDLPIEKSLGFAHVVPYGGVAQFQMAAKGYIQLALRSAQYQRMNAKPINAEAFGGYDEVGEPKILWENLDETKPVIGYAVAWRLTNGFTKVAYWPRAKVEAHAQRFSKAYAAKKQDSPWFSNFDKMAIKTVVMNELRAWGVLSVQMQTALKHDMATVREVGAEPEYIDNDNDFSQTDGGAVITDRPPPPPRATKGASRVKENASKPAEVIVTEAEQAASETKTVTPEPKTVTPAPEPAKTVTPLPAKPKVADPITQKALLAENETLVVTAMIDEFKVVAGTKNNAPYHYVTGVITSPEFKGQVHQYDNSLVPGTINPIPAWQMDCAVRVSLRGKKLGSGAHRTVVESIVEAQPDMAAGGDEV